MLRIHQFQLVFLVLFALFALLTGLLQIRYGMLTGKSEAADPQSDPAAAACRRKATVCAIVAGCMLAICIALGVITRVGG